LKGLFTSANTGGRGKEKRVYRFHWAVGSGLSEKEGRAFLIMVRGKRKSGKRMRTPHLLHLKKKERREVSYTPIPTTGRKPPEDCPGTAFLLSFPYSQGGDKEEDVSSSLEKVRPKKK